MLNLFYQIFIFLHFFVQDSFNSCLLRCSMPANTLMKLCALGVRSSYNQCSFQVQTGFGSHMFHSFAPFLAQIVVTQTVFFFVNELFQFDTYRLEPRRINDALKNRVLHTLTVILAGFCYLAQTLFPASVSVVTS